MHRIVINRTCTLGANGHRSLYRSVIAPPAAFAGRRDERAAVSNGPDGGRGHRLDRADEGAKLAERRRQHPSRGGGRAAKDFAEGGSHRACPGIDPGGRATACQAIARHLSRRNFDLYHEPNYLPLPSDLPKVVTIHDLSVFLYPQWHPAKRIEEFGKGFRAMLGQAAHFITDAECVRRELLQTFDVPAEKVTCIHPGIGERYRPELPDVVRQSLHKLGLEPGYFLAVGAIEPRKNLLLAIQAYCALPTALRERHPLVLAGPWGWGWKEVREFFETEARHRGVRHLGYVPDDALPTLYQGAKALIYPSLYEGFGLPPLEMAACGGAVLAADIPPLRETLGSRALFVSPHNAEGWRQLMYDACADDEMLEPYRRASRSIKEQFAWSAAAPKFREIYRQVLEGGSLRLQKAA